MKWPFQDPTKLAAYTSRRIVYGEEWIHYVTHDADDGAWQFHPHSGPTPEADACIVSLENMLGREPRLAELADVPLGWHVWRQDPEAEWQRAQEPWATSRGLYSIPWGQVTQSPSTPRR